MLPSEHSRPVCHKSEDELCHKLLNRGVRCTASKDLLLHICWDSANCAGPDMDCIYMCLSGICTSMAALQDYGCMP